MPGIENSNVLICLLMDVCVWGGGGCGGCSYLGMQWPDACGQWFLDSDHQIITK